MKPEINNAVYDSFGEAWYEGAGHPVALLRAEARLKNPWVLGEIRARLGGGEKNILDLGCGGGILSNFLAEHGHRVTGVDLSAPSLEIARKRDVTASVTYLAADAMLVPLSDSSFDVVCAMDFLEHVDEPGRVIGEAARLLRPGGLLFFHTFNRTLLSWLLAVKGIHWFVKNTPPNLHVFHLFIRPDELIRMGESHGLRLVTIRGIRPRIGLAFLRLLLTREVDPGFGFGFTPLLSIGYLGCMLKGFNPI